MKQKIILTSLMILILAVPVAAQEQDFTRWYDKYDYAESVTTQYAEVSHTFSYDAPYDRAKYDFADTKAVKTAELEKVQIVCICPINSLGFAADVYIAFTDLGISDTFTDMKNGQVEEILIGESYTEGVEHQISADVITRYEPTEAETVGISIVLVWKLSWTERGLLNSPVVVLAFVGFSLLMLSVIYFRRNDW